MCVCVCRFGWWDVRLEWGGVQGNGCRVLSPYAILTNPAPGQIPTSRPHRHTPLKTTRNINGMAISNLRLQPQAPETKSEGLKPIPPKVSPETGLPQSDPGSCKRCLSTFPVTGCRGSLVGDSGRRRHCGFGESNPQHGSNRLGMHISINTKSQTNAQQYR